MKQTKFFYHAPNKAVLDAVLIHLFGQGFIYYNYNFNNLAAVQETYPMYGSWPFVTIDTETGIVNTSAVWGVGCPQQLSLLDVFNLTRPKVVSVELLNGWIATVNENGVSIRHNVYRNGPSHLSMDAITKINKAILSLQKN